MSFSGLDFICLLKNLFKGYQIFADTMSELFTGWKRREIEKKLLCREISAVRGR